MTSSASSLSSSSGVSAVRLAPQQRRRGHRQLHRQQQEQLQERQGRASAGRCITRQQPDAASSSSSRRRKLLPAAVLAVSGALLMLSSNGSNNGSSNLRLASSRKLSATTATGNANGKGNGKGNPPRKLMNGDAAITDHKRQPPSAARRVQNEKISPAISETVHRLAQPFLDDEANIFAFDANDSRPVINTFFAIPEGQSIQKVDAETLAVWKRAWSSAGWNPRILNIGHAEAHPEYAGIVSKLNSDVPLGEAVFYDRSCYLRHFAMAALGGGWMTDYDTIPLNMDAEVFGREFPNEGQFTTYEGHVPSLIVGSGEEWERVSQALLREGVDAGSNEDVGFVREGKPRLFSDMYALGELVKKDEVIVNEPHSVFQAHDAERTMATEIMAWDLEIMAEYLNRGTSLQQHCEETKYIMALHFSHSATTSFGYLPDDRPILIAAFLDRWSRLCGGPAFHFDGNDNAKDDADSGALPEGPAEAQGIAADANTESANTSTEATPTNAISDALYETDGTMAISRVNKLLYVHIPKTGGSSLEESALFQDAWAHHQIGGHRPIDFMTQDAEERQLTDFVKVAHIRHPCDRFVSAFAYLTSDKCNPGDKEWAKKYIKGMSIDDFVLQLEKNPELLQWAHFTPMWRWVFMPEGTFGIDVAMCQETWDQSLDRLSNGFNLPVPNELYSTHALQNKHSKCEDLLPKTKAAIERIYQMDYCIFGYDTLPQPICPHLEVAPEEFTERYSTCTTPKLADKSSAATSRRRNLAVTRQRQLYQDLTPTKSMSLSEHTI